MSTLVVATLKSNSSSPPAFQNTSGTEIGQLCRAWVNFNGTGTVAIRAQFNVSSITDNGVGDYTVNFTTALSDTNYCVVGAGGNVLSQYGAYLLDNTISRARTTSAVSVASYSSSNSWDNQFMNVSIFR